MNGPPRGMKILASRTACRSHRIVATASAPSTSSGCWPREPTHVLSLVHDRAEQAQAETLRALGASVHRTRAAAPQSRAWRDRAVDGETATHVLLHSPEIHTAIARMTGEWPDPVLAHCSGIAPVALMPRSITRR
jgi:hypothetical protein